MREGKAKSGELKLEISDRQQKEATGSHSRLVLLLKQASENVLDLVMP